MHNIDIDADAQQRLSIEKTKKQLADLALAGFRKPIYTGVFKRLTNSTTQKYICALVLDGYLRGLTIQLQISSFKDDNGKTQHKYVCKIQSLPPFFKSKSLELSRKNSKYGRIHLKGTLALGATRIVITVLPHRDAKEANLWICVFEVLRSEEKCA